MAGGGGVNLGKEHKEAKEAALVNLEAKAKRENERVESDEQAAKNISEEMKKAAGKTEESGKKAGESLKKETDTYKSELAEADVDTKEAVGKAQQAAIEGKSKIDAATQKMLDIGTGDEDPTKVAEKLAKEQERITKERVKLAEEKIAQSEKLGQWYEGIATSYEDIGQRYKDAVTGLTESERKQMKGTAQQDYAAMSSVAGQAFGTATRGGTATGHQQAGVAAALQRGATDAYSASMNRMESIDQQRREMQFAIAQQANADERANRGLGATIMSGQIGLANEGRDSMGNALQEGQDRNAAMIYGANMDKIGMGFDKFGNTLAGQQAIAGYDAFAFDTAMQGVRQGMDSAGAAYGAGSNYAMQLNALETGSIDANLAADTYLDEAGISMRAGLYAESLAAKELAMKEKAMRDAKDASMMSGLGGLVGGAVGAYATGTPQGAAAGYTIGSGAGSGLAGLGG